MWPFEKKCVICKNSIRWGDFAYKQEICWNCFCEQVSIVIQRLEGLDEAQSELVAHIFAVFKETYFGRREMRYD